MLGDWIKSEIERSRLEPLRSMSIAQLRRLWDGIGDDSFSSRWDCADIHLVMNEKGDGEYCAV